MSTFNKITVLAFASTVLASQHAPAYGYGHKHGHQHLHSSPALYPYPSANSTRTWGSTGLASGVASYIATSSAPTYPQGSAETMTSIQYETEYETVHQTVSNAYPSSGSGVGVSAGGASSVSAEACGQDVTVTSTEKVYVTITAGYAAPSSQDSPVSSSSSQPAAPVYNSASAPAYSAPAYSAPAYSAPTTSNLPVSSSVAATNNQVGPSSTSSAPATYSSTSPSSGGKRGLAYNSADLTTCFDGSKEITWAYNWVSSSAGLAGGLNYVPTLHDCSDTFTSVWNDEASASIGSGSTTLFSFNEPDEPSQANMTPQDAAEAYIKYMNPFAGKAKLCAPSVTNGPASQNMGLTWLQQFVDACAGNCHIDCYNIHWYSPADAGGFKDHVTQAIGIAGDKPVWVSEFGCTGASDDEVSSFLEEVMPWMDSNESIAGYAYFMAADGTLVTGTEPSTYGNTYMSFTA